MSPGLLSSPSTLDATLPVTSTEPPPTSGPTPYLADLLAPLSSKGLLSMRVDGGASTVGAGGAPEDQEQDQEQDDDDDGALIRRLKCLPTCTT